MRFLTLDRILTNEELERLCILAGFCGYNIQRPISSNKFMYINTIKKFHFCNGKLTLNCPDKYISYEEALEYFKKELCG